MKEMKRKREENGKGGWVQKINGVCKKGLKRGKRNSKIFVEWGSN